MSKLINTTSQILVWISAIAFVLLYLTLSYYNRLASDDIVFIALSKNQTLFQYISAFYQTWSGRWSGGSYFYIITNMGNSFQNTPVYIFLYYFISLIIFIYSIKSILHFSFLKFFNTCLDSSTLYLYSILFIASFYYFTFQCSEVWWWVCASVDTLQGIIFLLFGMSLLLKEQKNKFHYFLIFLSFIYVGGGFEIYSLIVESFCFLLFIYCVFKNQSVFYTLRKSTYTKGILIGIISLFFSSAISFSAPGNRNRRDAVTKELSLNVIANKQNTLVEISKNIFSEKKYILAAGLSSLWILLGMRLKKDGNADKKIALKKLLIISLLPFILSILITWGFQTLLMRGYSIPVRAWTFSSFSLTFFCCFLCLTIGYSFQFQSHALDYLIKVIVPLSIAILLSTNFIMQYKYASVYSRAYDQLISKLIDSRSDGRIKTIAVNKLPESGMLIPLDIADDYIKIPLKEFLDLKCEIKVIE